MSAEPVLRRAWAEGWNDEGGVFHQQDHPNHSLFSVIIHIALILGIFDQGQHDGGIAAPGIAVVETGFLEKTGLIDSVPNRMGEQDNRNIRVQLSDFHPEFTACHAAEMGHGDHQIEMLFFQELQCLFRIGRASDTRRSRKIQPVIFIDDSGGHRAVFLQDIGVIGTGDQQDLLYPEAHQLMEDFKMGIVLFIFHRFACSGAG